MPDHALPHPAVLIPRRLLIAAGPFGGLAPGQVAGAISRGLRAAGLPDPDVLELPAAGGGTRELAELLATSRFDARMRASRAVVVALARLGEATLAASPAFEIATRARQAGVPAYAITAANGLDAFDARILDLQLILEASGARELAAVGRRLAGVT
jgi:glycerate 2-kinase